MKSKVTGELIQQHGRQLRDLEIAPERAVELATEVERHSRAILNAAGMLDFNDEPSRFFTVLHELGRRTDAAPKRAPRKNQERNK